MSVNYEGEQPARRPAYAPPEETPQQVLARGRPFPPHEEMVNEELTDEEEAAFWAAINET